MLLLLRCRLLGTGIGACCSLAVKNSIRGICAAASEGAEIPQKTPAIDPSKVNEFRLVEKKERKKYEKCDVETSIRYMQSQAYKECYGENPVWVPFRRNFKGHYMPRSAAKSCVDLKTGLIRAGNPCPLCRDEYLVTDYRNVQLLRQFVDRTSGVVLHPTKTGLCKFQHENLLTAMLKAWDEGTIELENLPFRTYDYRQWYGEEWTKVYGADVSGPEVIADFKKFLPNRGQ